MTTLLRKRLYQEDFPKAVELAKNSAETEPRGSDHRLTVVKPTRSDSAVDK